MQLIKLLMMDPIAFTIVDEQFLALSNGTSGEEAHLKRVWLLREMRRLMKRSELDVGFGSDAAVVVDETRFVAPIPTVQVECCRIVVLWCVIERECLKGGGDRIGRERVGLHSWIVAETQIVGRVKVGIELGMKHAPVRSYEDGSGNVVRRKESKGASGWMAGEVATGGMKAFGVPGGVLIDGPDDQRYVLLEGCGIESVGLTVVVRCSR